MLPVNLLVFNKNKAQNRRGKILFINAADRSTEGQRAKRTLSDEEIRKIRETIQSGNEIKEFSKSVHIKDIRDGNLLPSRYLAASEMQIAGHGTVKVYEDRLEKMKTVALKEKADFLLVLTLFLKIRKVKMGNTG